MPSLTLTASQAALLELAGAERARRVEAAQAAAQAAETLLRGAIARIAADHGHPALDAKTDVTADRGPSGEFATLRWPDAEAAADPPANVTPFPAAAD